MKKYLWMLCAVMISLFLFLTVSAETNRVIFTNRRSENTGLYVTKHVDSSVSSTESPEDDLFSFSLNLNHNPAQELSYRLFGNDGKEIFNYGGTLTTEKNENQIAIPFQTDRNGNFTLKNGQTACFENLRIGSFYEVSEEQKPNYIQSEPAGGSSAIGNITQDGNAVTFRNLYVPNHTTDQENTILEIRKQIAFPTGYKVPESPDFWFTITIQGKPWRNETYTIIDSASEEILTTGSTDENGSFSMKGGCTAHFKNIPANTDYLITEKETEGWRSISDTVITGATKSPLTYVSFTNAEASFAITKTMEKPAVVENPFTFELKKNGMPWSEAEYYLYKTSGIQIDTELHQTNIEGKFTLFPEQAAIFVRADSGTVYSVSEIADETYIQTLPQQADGYLNKIVSDSIEILPFVNRYDENASANLLLRLTKKGTDGTVLPGTVFKLYADQALTEEICEIATKSNGTADIGEIEPGTYYLKETCAPKGYQLLSNPLELEIEKEQILINGHTYTGTNETDDAYFKETADGMAVYVTIYNHKNFSLPITGGSGTAFFTLIAIVGIFSTLFLLLIFLTTLDKTL